MAKSAAVCRHKVAKRFCGLCGAWGGGKPGQADVERKDGYLMDSGDWQDALWEWDGMFTPEQEALHQQVEANTAAFMKLLDIKRNEVQRKKADS